MKPETPETNAEMVRYWNEHAGSRWVAHQELLDQQMGSLSEMALDEIGVAAGMRVLDVGCGCGHTTLQLGERVGPRGSVLGVDVSKVMLERARQRAREAGLDALRFLCADAQAHAFPEEDFDLVFSRFGIMFFANPVAAFANLRRALVPGGRFSFLCWQSPDRNPWMRVPTLAAAAHIPLPEAPAAGAPGPFSLADPKRVHAILREGGFEAIALESVERQLLIGGTASPDQALDFVLGMGLVSAMLRERPELRPQVAESIREALEPYRSEAGIRMDSACWLVHARRPSATGARPKLASEAPAR